VHRGFKAALTLIPFLFALCGSYAFAELSQGPFVASAPCCRPLPQPPPWVLATHRCAQTSPTSRAEPAPLSYVLAVCCSVAAVSNRLANGPKLLLCLAITC
jgi:hypothetical protein